MDQAERIADKLQALINSRPWSPTKAEIVSIIKAETVPAPDPYRSLYAMAATPGPQAGGGTP